MATRWYEHGWLNTHTDDDPLKVPAAEILAGWRARTSFGAWTKRTLVDEVPDKRIVETWHSKKLPRGWADPVSVLELEEKPDGTHVSLRLGSDREGGGFGYDAMIFFLKSFSSFCNSFERGKPAPPPAPVLTAPTGAAAKALRKQLGAVRTPAAWVKHLERLAPKKKRWWKSTAAVQRGLEAWVHALATASPMVAVAAAVGAAEVALPVWTKAARTRPPFFADIAGLLGPESGAPPKQVIAAARKWLAKPDAACREKAEATLDPTAQLRFTDKDMGDQSASRFTYALEAARCAVNAIADATEASLAAVAALEAIRTSDDAIAPADVAAIAEAIRASVLEVLA